jgi:hypothetical protein
MLNSPAPARAGWKLHDACSLGRWPPFILLSHCATWRHRGFGRGHGRDSCARRGDDGRISANNSGIARRRLDRRDAPWAATAPRRAWNPAIHPLFENGFGTMMDRRGAGRSARQKCGQRRASSPLFPPSASAQPKISPSDGGFVQWIQWFTTITKKTRPPGFTRNWILIDSKSLLFSTPFKG